MRTAAALIVVAALGGLFWWQKNSSQQTQTMSTKAAERPAVSSPAPHVVSAPREPSEHNWMKRSLDRARDVTNQSRAQTRDSQNP